MAYGPMRRITTVKLYNILRLRNYYCFKLRNRLQRSTVIQADILEIYNFMGNN